jgi:eukaryotic-like serine/threonine-protein kinase
VNAKREPQYCPHCGVAYEPLQEYCLECGERLPTNTGTVGVLAAWWQRRFAWYPGDWIWPALLFLVVAAVATAVSAATTSSSSTTIVATQPGVTVGNGTLPAATTGTQTLPAAPKPTVTTGTLPKAPGAVSTNAVTTPPPPTAPGLTVWPASGTAFTDVLASVPLASGREAALAKARAARTTGLPKAGVLVSAQYPSLRAGYYVVFSGIYATPGAALAALGAAHAHGFPDAYVARVTHP